MELRHFEFGGGFRALYPAISAQEGKDQMQKVGPLYVQGIQTHVNFHFLVQAIIHHQAVSHPNPMGLHGVASNIGIVADIGIVKICNALLLGAVIAQRDGRNVH